MPKNKQQRKLVLAITGASGMIYVKSFLQMVEASGDEMIVHGICSTSGQDVLLHETGCSPAELPVVSKWFKIDDFAAAPSSGSSGYDAMLILPCTMGTLGAIASGLSHNLIHRVADVILKERKKLVLGVRETPLNKTHLSNMLRVHEAGGVIFPPMPAFYLKPKTLDEAAMTYCWRLGDHLGINVNKRKRWEGTE